VRDAEFERLVRRHAQDVYAFLAYRTGDPDLAEELLADTLERAYRARSRFDPRRASEKTWLISIALNRWRDMARHRRSEEAAITRSLAAPEASEDPGDATLTRRSLLAALEELPEDEREVVTLTYGADLTAKQIAQLLEVPATTVRGRLYRGLARLRELVGADLGPR
jgi:RNA polymerase sigma-70 factor, ECF subfamily